MSAIDEIVRAFSQALETGDADTFVGHLAPVRSSGTTMIGEKSTR